MAVVRRNAGWFSVAGVLLCLIAGGWWLWSVDPAPAMSQQGGYTPLDEAAAGHIEFLRRENGLDNDVLASLNLDAEELETLLAAVRDWYETNSAQFVTRYAALADKHALIRNYRSQIGMGVDCSSELATAQQELAQLETSYETLVAGLRRAALAELSNSQQALAEHMRSRRDVPMPFRVLDLNAAQDDGWQRARRHYLQQLCATRDANARATFSSAYDQELATALGTQNLQNLGSLSGYLGAASVRVVTAVQTVLPVDDELEG